MARAKKNGADAPMTTAQMLGSLLKSARDIMRKDKGLNGDLDRLPLLTWIMFLKFLDDLEQQREDEASLAGKKFKPAIEKPYRWRDWAADAQGITGDELLAFINNDEARRPDGSKGPSLFAYLRSLSSSNGDNRRDVIATVFKGVDNRMKSGYLLRDVINKVGAIHFTSSDELHTLGALYESMLREMRDAAGDSGEFYTPRAVVRFMVEVTEPRLGEAVLDPASGTGGFLVEAYNYLERQVKTVADRKRLQTETITGCEPKSLPYLLCQMNLLLHGLDAPQIDPGNALRFKLSEIGEKERVEVILTNPPFGGEEEKGIQGNFPEDRQTAETALLFLQLIMRKLKRQPTSAKRPARAAVVVPNGTLFGDGVCARIKEELLKEFNLHTIVRLPNGVFAPYTSIPTNVLFFDRSGATKEVWYYEQPLPEGRKNYTKTQPMQFDEFKGCMAWWGKREENDKAWKVPVAELLEAGCNLDRKNPRGKVDFEHLPPDQLADDILKKELRIAELMREIKAALGGAGMSPAWAQVPLGEVVDHRKEFINIDDLQTYRRPRVQLHAQGIVLRDAVPGALIKTKKQQVVRAGEFLVAEIDAKVGGFGIVPDELDGAIVSSHYFLYGHRPDRLDNKYLGWFVKTRAFREQVEAQGSTNYAAIRPADVLGYKIPLPPLDEQRRIVARIEELAAPVEEARGLRRSAIEEGSAFLPAHLGSRFRELADHHPVQPLGDLSSHIVDGPHLTPTYLPDANGVPFVTVKNMVTGKLSFQNLNYVSRKDHREFSRRCRAERGDVLYSKDGATKGRPCYVDTDEEFSFFVALIKPLRNRLDGRFLVHLLNSSWIKDRMIDKSRGDMIPHIVLREIRAFPVPLPSLDQQHRIVAELDALQAKVDAVKALQTQAAAELDAMLPAILDKAFKGEL